MYRCVKVYWIKFFPFNCIFLDFESKIIIFCDYSRKTYSNKQLWYSKLKNKKLLEIIDNVSPKLFNEIAIGTVNLSEWWWQWQWRWQCCSKESFPKLKKLTKLTGDFESDLKQEKLASNGRIWLIWIYFLYRRRE